MIIFFLNLKTYKLQKRKYFLTILIIKYFIKMNNENKEENMRKKTREYEKYIGDAQRPSFVQGQQNQGFGNKKTLRQLFEVNPKKNRY
jgi:hypothetical protein